MTVINTRILPTQVMLAWWLQIAITLIAVFICQSATAQTSTSASQRIVHSERLLR